MEQIINDIINRLNEVGLLKYIDEDWGQLDYYSNNFPVKWPCALVDISNANFDDIGVDRKAVPNNRQIAQVTISITIADLRLTNSSHGAPINQKQNSFSIHNIINEIHKILQGWNVNQTTGKLIRTSQKRIKRDDGVQEYVINYSLSITNV